MRIGIFSGIAATIRSLGAFVYLFTCRESLQDVGRGKERNKTLGDGRVILEELGYF